MASSQQHQHPPSKPAPLAAKWDRYYAGAPGSAPFDSARPSSQLLDYLCSCMADRVCSNSRPMDGAALADLASKAPLCLPPEPPTAAQQQQLHVCGHCRAYKPPAGGRVLELGCGTGASARWLAHKGYAVTAIDVSATALQAAAAGSAAEGLPANNPQWLQEDVLKLQSPMPTGPAATQAAAGSGSAEGTTMQQPPAAQGPYDLIYDCQVYHVLIRDQEQHAASLPQLLFSLLRPGGLLMILAGNANEPEVGPNVLTAEELLRPLLAAGFELVLLQQTRFDSTQHYADVLGMRPLAWWVLLQRPG